MQLMPLHQVWRAQYRAHRYAEHLTREELEQRLRDVFLNLLVLNVDTKIGLPEMDDFGRSWMEIWTHALEELALRNGPFPAGVRREILHSEPFPNFASDLAKKAVEAMRKMDLAPRTVYIKYGTKEFMTTLFERGKLRIQPASFFNKKDLNLAIRDDELTFPVSLAIKRDQVLRLVHNPEDVPEDIGIQRMDVSIQCPTDYWMYCVTSSVNPRLFVDFNAEACVIIRNRGEFSKRIDMASASVLGGTEFLHGPVSYQDPLSPATVKPVVPFTKTIAYTYQQEHRFVWMPPIRVESATHYDVEVGSLSDIAELIVL